MTETVSDLRERIEGRLRDLELERTQLLGALKALGINDSAPAPSKPRRPASSRVASSRKSSSGRAPRGQNQELIRTYIAKNPEAKPKEIADATGIARTVVSSTLTRLRQVS